VGILLSVGLAGAGSSIMAADESPSIKDVMNAAHKKPKELLKKVATGKASQPEKEELVRLYQALAARRPPRGEASGWEEKTAALVAAAKAAVEGREDAPQELTRVANCAACHDAHKN
jgi:hypothetical protein